VDFLRHLRDGNKLNSGCKCLFASVQQKSNRWLATIQLLEKEFGGARDVEATENPFYRACAAAARSSDGYNYVTQLELKNKYEKPFAEYTVLPVRKNNELSLLIRSAKIMMKRVIQSSHWTICSVTWVADRH